MGRDLIWGIREDPRLARVGLGLPPTGGGIEERNVLPPTGTVVEISSYESERREWPVGETLVCHDVPVLRQTSAMSCWATVYAMMRAWKEGAGWSASGAVSDLGSPWDDYYLWDRGLPGGEEKSFVARAGMRTDTGRDQSMT